MRGPTGRERLRTMASVAVLLVGAFASLATSPAPDSIDSLAEGEGFLLDAEHPVAHATLGVRATEAATSGTVGVSLTIDELWVDTVRRGRLRIEIRREGGGPSSLWQLEPDRRAFECAGAACAGDWEIGFGLPERFPHGSVHVRWRAFAHASFGGDDVPGGAELEVTGGDVAGAAGPAGVTATGNLTAPTSLPVVVEHLEVRVPAALGDRRVLIFGRPGPTSAYGGSEMWVGQVGSDATEVTEVAPGEGVTLRPPDACRRGPCRLDVRVVVAVPPPGLYGDWRVAEGWVLDAAPPIDGLVVTSRRERVPSISGEGRLGHLAVHGFGDQDPTGATISLPASAAGTSAPIVFAQVTLEDYASDWPSPNADSAQVQLAQLGGPPAEPWTSYGKPDPAAGLRPPGALLTPRCRPGRACTVDVALTLGIGSEANGADAVVEGTPVLRVILLYPFGEPPRGARITVEASA